MARISAIYQLSNSQAELDFVDVDTSSDMQLYLDPYAIQIRSDEWSAKCGDHVRSYFAALLDALRANNIPRATHLLDHLHEPNETYLGQSKGEPRGRAVGNIKAGDLANSLVNSQAFETGVLSDISEAELFIRGIGPDTISDLTTNVLRGPLADYTREQCELHGIPYDVVHDIDPIWNPLTEDWQSVPLRLPRFNGRPILFVPKYSVRLHLSLNSQEFWNHHMIEFLRAEYINSSHGLVRFLKDGTPHLSKKKVKERHPLIKDDLARFVSQHPEILEAYKQIKGAQGPLSNEDLYEGFDERAFAIALSDRLRRINVGNDAASEYHSIALGICTFLFYPGLIDPIKEREIHQGRKRIDIKFTNAGEMPFFDRISRLPQTRSISVPIECKNYRKDINNPELDQLSGRFGHQRGLFGMLLCRSIEDRARIVAGCRDAANDGRGFIVVFEDDDLHAMLRMVSEGRRGGINGFLQQRFDEVTH